MPEEAKKKKRTAVPPLPSARPSRPSVAFQPSGRKERGSLLGSRIPSSWPPPPPEPEAPAPPEIVPSHMTLEQRAKHDLIVEEAQEREAKRQQGFIRDVLDPIWIDPSQGSRWGYYGGVTPPAPQREFSLADTLEPLKIFDVLGRGVRKYFTGMSETQLAAPGEQSRLLANIVTDMLTDPLLVAGLAKAGVAGLRGIRSLLNDVVSAGLAGQDPGVAQMFSRVRPEQLDELATQLQQGLLQSGIKRLPPNFQRALVRSLAPGGAIADQRGGIHPAYEGLFAKSPSNMYSQMGRALEQKLPGRASPKELRQLVNKFWQKGDFKKAELEWSGLEEWLTSRHLNDPTKKISKEDLLDYVRANELEVKVVTRQGTEASGQYSSYVEGDPANWSDYQEVLVTLPSREATYSQHFSDDTLAWFRTVERKFKDPVTGEERRVLFIEELQSDWHQKGRQLGYADEGDLVARSDDYEEMRELFEEAESNYEVLTDDYGMNADDAYYQLEETKTRYGDIEGDLEMAQGEWNDLDMEADEVLSELQLDADAFEADRQLELPGTPKHEPPDVAIPDEMQDKLDDLQIQIDELEGDLRGMEDEMSDAESAHDSLQEAEEQLNDARNDFEQADETPEEGGKPPRAPYEKSWPELAFKRMLQKAVDDGYDTIAWSRGQVQADRYNAAMHIEDIKWTKGTGPGRGGEQEAQYFLEFRTKADMEANITTNWRQATAPEATLNDWVGRKIGDKMRAGGESGLLENEELWLGGEKLRFFYDGEMRNVANKLVKRFGGKVTKESMGPTFQVVEIPADPGTFVSWADKEIPRLRLQRDALRAEIVKLRDLSPATQYRPTLENKRALLGRRAQGLDNRQSMLTAAQSRVNAGTGLDKIDPTVIEAFMKANPNLEVKYGIKDPTNRTRTGKMVFDTLKEAEAAAAPTVNTIRITPKMREAIVERGFPLYQILLGTTGAAGAAEAMSSHKELRQ